MIYETNMKNNNARTRKESFFKRSLNSFRRLFNKSNSQ